MLANTNLQGPRLQPISLSRAQFSFLLDSIFWKRTFWKTTFLRSEILFTACFLQHRLFIAINTTHLATFSSFRTLFTLSHEMVPKTARSGQKGQFLAFDQGFSWKHTRLAHWHWDPNTESHRSITNNWSTRTLLIDLRLVVQNSNMHNGMISAMLGKVVILI